MEVNKKLGRPPLYVVNPPISSINIKQPLSVVIVQMTLPWAVSILWLMAVSSTAANALALATDDCSCLLFLGDSLLELWLCERARESSEPTVRTDCRWRQERQSDISDAEAAGDFSSSSEVLRSSLFYQAFPNALNAGRSGWRVEEWSAAIRFRDRVLSKAATLGHHTHIFVEIGANNIHYTDPPALVGLIVELTGLLHQLFPSCKILLLSVLPRPIGRHFLAERIEETNRLLYERFTTNRTPDEAAYISFFDISRHFYLGNEVDRRAFHYDRLHLNRHGYTIFEAALKAIIRESLP